ncbi:MAG: hypothetical protein IKW59_01185 [Clostridia bacterium]|nr:hypothetical protein [Clostridia bacterium]
MLKKTALIIDNKKEYSGFEILKFYCFKKLNLNIKEIITETTNFYIINIPIPEKIKEKNIKYLTQYIKSIMDKYRSNTVFYCWQGKNKDILYNKFNNTKNNISYVRLYPLDYIIKKYVIFFNKSINLVNLILICDSPIEAEILIRQVCRDIRSVHIYSKNKELYKPLTDYFLSEYGIFISVSENIDNIDKKNKIAVNLSNNLEYIKQFIKKNEMQVLNLSDKNLNIKNVYENMLFRSNKSLENVISYLGLFDKNVLNFIFKSMYSEKNKAEFMRFIHKFDIKITKFVKND